MGYPGDPHLRPQLAKYWGSLSEAPAELAYIIGPKIGAPGAGPQALGGPI